LSFSSEAIIACKVSVEAENQTKGGYIVKRLMVILMSLLSLVLSSGAGWSWR